MITRIQDEHKRQVAQAIEDCLPRIQVIFDLLPNTEVSIEVDSLDLLQSTSISPADLLITTQEHLSTLREVLSTRLPLLQQRISNIIDLEATYIEYDIVANEFTLYNGIKLAEQLEECRITIGLEINFAENQVRASISSDLITRTTPSVTPFVASRLIWVTLGD
jgi:hypothetical protein